MKTSTQMVLYLLLSYPLWSFALSPATQAVTSVCGHTHDQALCTSTSVRYASSYPVSAINPKAVLEMHLRATAKRASNAQNNAKTLARKYPSAISNALRSCGSLYTNIIDLVGVCLRAIEANDQQTKQMVQISLMEVRQSVQQCDMPFQKMKVKNPMAHFDSSLTKMSVNCDDLNNIM